MHVDHIGIATDDADALAGLFGDLFHAPVAHEEEFEGMWVTFLELDGSYVELLEPLDSESAVGRFIEERGPGMHHLALATTDIDAALDDAHAHGVDLIDEEPRQGAWGHDVAFLHPNSTGGVLVEFVEH